MQQNDSYDVSSNLSPRSDPGGAAGRFQPSAKLMNKMEKLAKWRIDPSLIEFPKDAEELHGGHATVSRAVLNPPFNKSVDDGELNTRSHAGQKDVAVKKLKIPADKDLERLLGLTLREAGFLVELSHRNIVRLEGFVEDVSEGIIWLVFPWEANGNLRDFIASRDWEIPERIWLIDDVARGVEYLHSQNPPICHGDLKSVGVVAITVNVLVNSKCRALITDFGSARRLADAETEQVGNERQPAPRLEATFCAATNTITLTGNEYTLRWAAPELLKDEAPTVKIDIWALGWIAYEVMTNAIPFEDVAKESIVIKRVTQGHLPSITGDARMSLMLRLCWLMSQCWNADPSQRPSATDCRKSLDWMILQPMIAPNPNRELSAMATDARSPQLLLHLGEMHIQQDDYANASQFYMEALRIFTETADQKGRAETLRHLAEMRRLRGDAEEAIALYSEALEISTSIDDIELKAQVLWGLAQTHTIQKKYSQAVTLYSHALKIYSDIGDIKGGADALLGLAEVHRREGESSKAATLYSNALRFFGDIGEHQGRASAMFGLAQVYRLQNDYSQAITFFSDALKICTDIGDTRGRGLTLVGVAEVKCDQGHHNDAIDHYEEAAKIFEQIGNAGMIAYVSEGAAEARRLAGLEGA
ncbi:hypothetical protein FRC01_004444 [Tulasnella sp. 417]|nr:hypothetical protein FRC01_004444 [Tulasnella sp. 417]